MCGDGNSSTQPASWHAWTGYGEPALAGPLGSLGCARGMFCLSGITRPGHRVPLVCYWFVALLSSYCCHVLHVSGIYPLQNVAIRKVKVLKAPKFDLIKLMEVHGDYTEEVGAKVERPAAAPAAEGETPAPAAE